jgi:hypothetical protein
LVLIASFKIPRNRSYVAHPGVNVTIAPFGLSLLVVSASHSQLPFGLSLLVIAAQLGRLRGLIDDGHAPGRTSAGRRLGAAVS